MAEHTVKAFGEELRRLKTAVSEMGALVLEQLEAALDVLTEHDPERAEAVAERDREVDAHEREIEQAALRLLAFRRPVARDFRIAVTAMRFAHSLERTGDIAKSMARRERQFEAPGPADLTREAGDLGRLVCERLRRVLAAYETGAVDAAMTVWIGDAEVDDRAAALYRRALERMAERSDEIAYLAHLLFVAKNLERVGDHATNLAEAVRYESTGESTTEERPRG